MNADSASRAPASWAGSYGAVLETIARHVPPALLAPEQLSAASRRVAVLPAELSDWEYLELWLGGDAPRLDLILGVGQAGRRLLAESEPTSAEAHELPTWVRLRAFARAWDTPPLARTIQRIWLELDLGAGAGDPLAAPGVFLDLHEESCRRAEPLLDLPGQALTILAGAPLDRTTQASVHAALAQLPPAAFAPFFGLFPGRPGTGLRVCITGLGAADLPPYLALIGWPDHRGELSGLLEEIAALPGPVPRPLLLHLDYAPTLQPRIGLELVFQREPQVHGGIRESAFLLWLERLGLLTPDYTAALPAWPGVSVERFPHELWPSLLHRVFNHVKLLLEPGRPLRAKAYLACHHAPRPRRPPQA